MNSETSRGTLESSTDLKSRTSCISSRRACGSFASAFLVFCCIYYCISSSCLLFPSASAAVIFCTGSCALCSHLQEHVNTVLMLVKEISEDPTTPGAQFSPRVAEDPNLRCEATASHQGPFWASQCTQRARAVVIVWWTWVIRTGCGGSGG